MKLRRLDLMKLKTFQNQANKQQETFKKKWVEAGGKGEDVEAEPIDIEAELFGFMEPIDVEAESKTKKIASRFCFVFLFVSKIGRALSSVANDVI